MSEIGIYRIYNIKTNQNYIGQSVNLRQRLASHKSSLKHKRHHNDHLQKSFNKYKIDNFIFEVITYCKEDELDAKERYYISFFNSLNEGFNKDAGGNLKKRLTSDTKKKLRDINIGKKLSIETRNKISESGKGRVVSSETSKKLSEINKGVKFSKDRKEKIRIKALGRVSPNRKQVIDLSTGFVWDSIQEAANIYGLKYTTLASKLNGNRKNNTTLRLI